MKQNTSPTPLCGKKLAAIGDSMVQGHILSDAANQTWVAKIASRNGMRHKNYGMNGTALSYNDVYDGQFQKKDSVVGRYSSMDDDADYVLVYAGTNDIYNGIALGEDDSADPSTICGAVHALCEGLKAKYPGGKIGFITPYAPGFGNEAYQSAQLYIDAIVRICNKHGIPVFDNSKDGGIDWEDPVQAKSYTLEEGGHLNEAGMEYVSYRYEAFLRSL